jgi:hypothetical protein
MLSRVRSHDGTTVTIYSEKIAVGGLTSAKNGHWYWALFGVNDTGLDEVVMPLEFGGVEQDMDSAFEALSRHWRQWLEAAGLSYQAQDYLN